jgi:hypothetical protein
MKLAAALIVLVGFLAFTQADDFTDTRDGHLYRRSNEDKKAQAKANIGKSL